MLQGGRSDDKAYSCCCHQHHCVCVLVGWSVGGNSVKELDHFRPTLPAGTSARCTARMDCCTRPAAAQECSQRPAAACAIHGVASHSAVGGSSHAAS